MAPPSRRPRSPPALMEDLVEEILLRVPPDEPAHLLRAALVCKPWRSILTGRGFLRRYAAFHRAPPLLGYLHNLYRNGEGPIPPFVSTITPASPLSPPPLGRNADWWALDCRHGRVLINSHPAGVSDHLVVWDPISGDMKRLGMPPYPFVTTCAGAVLCAVHGCDHLDCHAGPFQVVFVGTPSRLRSDFGTWASVYSSETGVWGPSVSIDVGNYQVAGKPSLLIGDALYFTLEYGLGILKYELGRHVLSEIEPLSVFGGSLIFMEFEDGALGIVTELNNCVYKWVRQAGTGKWEHHMVMKLEIVLPRPAPDTTYDVVGLVEGTNTIFINGYGTGVFTLDLKSRKVKRVGESDAYYFILPYMSFYTPGSTLRFS